MNRKPFKDAAWDTYDSTYIQKIELKNGKEFTGYSKKVGHAEKNDKEALLINMIIRMHKYGYLDKNHHERRRRINVITYSINRFPEKKEVIRLFYTHYEVVNESWAVENMHVIRFLDEFYEALKTDNIQQIKSLYIVKKTRYNDPFDLSKKRFITKKSLLDYCHRMMEEKVFSTQQADHFYSKYLEKYNVR